MWNFATSELSKYLKVSKYVGSRFAVCEHVDLNVSWAKLVSGNQHLEEFCFADPIALTGKEEMGL